MRRPTFPYPGGKARLAKEIVSYFPRSGRWYVEPFAGRGNVYWKASQLDFKKWHLNDIRTASFFEALRDLGPCAVPERTETEYYRLWARKKANPRDHEALLIEPYLTFRAR